MNLKNIPEENNIIDYIGKRLEMIEKQNEEIKKKNLVQMKEL